MHGGTEGISRSILAMGDELADRLAALKQYGCVVVVSIAQEIEDEASLGVSFSEGAVSWLARAGAGISIDQYVETGS